MRTTATSCVTRGRKRITPHIGVPQTAMWRAERAARPTVPSLACRNLYLYFAAGYGDCVEPVGLNGCASWCGCEPNCSAACTPSPGSWQVRRLRLRLLQQPLGQRKLQPAAPRTRGTQADLAGLLDQRLKDVDVPWKRPTAGAATAERDAVLPKGNFQRADRSLVRAKSGGPAL